MPRRLIAVMAYSAVPGFPIETVPAIRNGSRSPNMPANGPSVPGCKARVSSRACRMSLSSCSSTRSESYIFRTFQSIPAPISEAISFGVSTTESGPVAVRRFPTLAFPDATALGVGAPTAVSATGGSAVEPPNQCVTVCMIGSRNHHASASAPITTTAQPSLKTPLRQPSMVFHVIHRPTRFEDALHQVDLCNGDRGVEIRAVENLRESLEIARARIASRAAQRHVRPKRPRFGRKAEGSERLFHAMLQQLESGVGGDTRPQHLRPVIVREHTESGDLQRQGTGLGARPRGALQGLAELRLPRFLHVAQKLETEVNVLGTHPLHRQLLRALAQGREGVPELLAYARGKIQGDERSNRLPRRYPRGSTST